MSRNKRQKMDIGAASSSASDNTQEMSTTSAGAHYGADRGSPNENKKKQILFIAGRTKFREAVRWTGFVDKSLLIKELLEQDKDKEVMIFAPKRFGKSLNLDMIECFFEIEAGRDITKAPQDLEELKKLKNFQVFSRYNRAPQCKILDHTKLVKEYFGRHPVLHLDFKDIEVSSVQTVKDDVRTLVHEAYRKHSYLKTGDIFSNLSDTEDANKDCRIWCDLIEYEKQNAIAGLKKLIRYLHAYHKRKVYLLIDEFDAPAVKALLAHKPGSEVYEISSVVTNLLGALVKGDVAGEHLLGSLITGVSYLGGIGISEEMNSVSVYKWLLKDRFAEYYGLRNDELTALLERVFPDQEKKQVEVRAEVLNLYNGYAFKNEKVYCLWSVLHYIRERSTCEASEIKEKTFWGGSSIISRMGYILNNSGTMENMIDLVGGGHIYFDPCAKVEAQDLANLLNGKECDEDILLSFFLEQGYFSQENVQLRGEEIRVQIANEDVLAGFQQMFIDFCEKNCGLSDNAMEECANIFNNLPSDINDDMFKELLKNLHNHLSTLLSQFKDRQGVNERSIQAALYVSMLRANLKECCMEKYVIKGNQTGRIDLWMLDDNFVCIVEIKYNKVGETKKSSRQACSEILDGGKSKKVPYVEILADYSHIKNYFLIGLSVNAEGKPYFCGLLNNQDPERCIFFPMDD